MQGRRRICFVFRTQTTTTKSFHGVIENKEEEHKRLREARQAVVPFRIGGHQSQRPRPSFWWPSIPMPSSPFLSLIVVVSGANFKAASLRAKLACQKRSGINKRTGTIESEKKRKRKRRGLRVRATRRCYSHS